MQSKFIISLFLVILNMINHFGQVLENGKSFSINCPFTILKEGPSNNALHGAYVITNAFDFEDYWKSVFGPDEVHEYEAHWASVFGPPVKIPCVGFDNYMVVAINMPGNGFCTLEIEGISETRDNIIINLEVFQSGHRRTANISRRCIVIKMKKTFKPIEIV